MGLKDKINKIKARRRKDSKGGEKTGVLNSLVVIGAIAGAMLAGDTASAEPKCDASTHEVTDTQIASGGTSGGGDIPSSWDNHYWWDHSWYDHSWYDWSDWSDWTLDAGP